MLREFAGDLGKALGAWRRAPLLPMLTLALQIPFYLSEHRLWQNVGWATFVFYVGYVGTERIWYLATWRGERLGPREVWTYSWQYFPRYLGLGVVSSLVLLIPGGLLIWIVDELFVGGTRLLAGAISTAIWDVWLTFMTPALAFSTPLAGKAMSIGWRVLKRSWPGCALYVLAPPLASLVLIQQEQSFGLGTKLPLVIAAVLVYLALKGATAAYYIRHEAPDLLQQAAIGPPRKDSVTVVSETGLEPARGYEPH